MIVIINTHLKDLISWIEAMRIHYDSMPQFVSDTDKTKTRFASHGLHLEWHTRQFLYECVMYFWSSYILFSKSYLHNVSFPTFFDNTGLYDNLYPNMF